MDPNHSVIKRLWCSYKQPEFVTNVYCIIIQLAVKYSESHFIIFYNSHCDDTKVVSSELFHSVGTV